MSLQTAVATNTVVDTVPVGIYPYDVEVATPPAPPRPVIAGSTWYSNGTRVGSATAGTTVGARAVAAVPNLSYQLVLARGGCADVVAVLNPATVTRPAPA